MKNFQIKEDTFWLDNLRVIATISVIILHVAAPIASKFGAITPTSWWWGNIYDSLTRFCVPIFVMLTGALLLSKTYTLKDYLKKRFLRIVLPFLFWTVIYIVHTIIHLPKNFTFNVDTISKLILKRFTYGAAYHFWYIYMIIGIYLIIPIISPWIKKASEKELLYFILIWLLTIIITQPIIAPYAPNFNLSYFSGYIGYLVLGYYLSIKNFDTVKQIKLYSFGLFMLAVLITLYGTYYLSQQKGKFIVYFYQYFSLNVVLASIGIFIWFKQLRLRNSTFIKLRDFINKQSFSIYFIHILILFYLNRMGINGALFGVQIGIILTSLLCLCLSSIISYLLKKLPYIAKLVG